MSGGYCHDEWLMLKHRTKPRGFVCGQQDSDWDFVDPTHTSYSGGYTLRSSETPVQLRNNYGGMDEDEDTTVKDVWYPQHRQQTEDTDSGLGSRPGPVGSDMAMDCGMDMDIDMDTTDSESINSTEQQMQQLPSAATSSAGSSASKRKRDVDFDGIEMNTGRQMQCMEFDTAKRVRVSV